MQLVSDNTLDEVRLAPPDPVISVIVAARQLSLWVLVPALQLAKTMLDKAGRISEIPSTIHSAIAPMDVMPAGFVMPILVIWLVVLFIIVQNPCAGVFAQTRTVR